MGRINDLKHYSERKSFCNASALLQQCCCENFCFDQVDEKINRINRRRLKQTTRFDAWHFLGSRWMCVILCVDLVWFIKQCCHWLFCSNTLLLLFIFIFINPFLVSLSTPIITKPGGYIETTILRSRVPTFRLMDSVWMTTSYGTLVLSSQNWETWKLGLRHKRFDFIVCQVKTVGGAKEAGGEETAGREETAAGGEISGRGETANRGEK